MDNLSHLWAVYSVENDIPKSFSQDFDKIARILGIAMVVETCLLGTTLYMIHQFGTLS